MSLTGVLHFQVDPSVVVLQLVLENPGPAAVRLRPAPTRRPPVLAQERHFAKGQAVNEEGVC